MDIRITHIWMATVRGIQVRFISSFSKVSRKLADTVSPGPGRFQSFLYNFIVDKFVCS